MELKSRKEQNFKLRRIISTALHLCSVYQAIFTFPTIEVTYIYCMKHLKQKLLWIMFTSKQFKQLSVQFHIICTYKHHVLHIFFQVLPFIEVGIFCRWSSLFTICRCLLLSISQYTTLTSTNKRWHNYIQALKYCSIETFFEKK